MIVGLPLTPTDGAAAAFCSVRPSSSWRWRVGAGSTVGVWVKLFRLSTRDVVRENRPGPGPSDCSLGKWNAHFLKKHLLGNGGEGQWEAISIRCLARNALLPWPQCRDWVAMHIADHTNVNAAQNREMRCDCWRYNCGPTVRFATAAVGVSSLKVLAGTNVDNPGDGHPGKRSKSALPDLFVQEAFDSYFTNGKLRGIRNWCWVLNVLYGISNQEWGPTTFEPF